MKYYPGCWTKFKISLHDSTEQCSQDVIAKPNLKNPNELASKGVGVAFFNKC